MKFRNTSNQFGLVTLLLHWTVAITVICMFALGLWMVELDYYDEWYKRGPDIHKSIGILLLITMLFRLVWRMSNPHPKPVNGSSSFEIKASRLVHNLIYILVFSIMVAGYLISTADGRSIDVFTLFSVPATLTGIEDQEDVAGVWHYYMALVLMVIVSLHSLAALKHHFINKDETLKRIIGLSSHPENSND